MFLELGFELGEGGFDGGTNVGGDPGGVKRAGGKRKIERESEFDFARVLSKAAVELDEVGGKGF